MILLIFFAFLAGIVTILSPCILPMLPIILSASTDTSGIKRPLGVIVGFVASFTFFTLFLSSIVKLSGIPAETLRYLSIIILILFGFSLIIPQMQLLLERMFNSLARFAPQGKNRRGFFGGLIIGLSLGLLWTPCVGPILASVITLALSGNITGQAILITLAYSLGTAIPMFLIMIAGSTALKKIPWLLRNTVKIQKIFGVMMIMVAMGIFFNMDRQFQSYILKVFPQYGAGLTKFEENVTINKDLKQIEETNPVAPEIVPGDGAWFNSPPLKLADLRGKVVVVDFWTYSCINCQRTLPYLRNWWDKYKDKGLVIIGVHAPEFEFEKDKNNVAKAIADFKLTYPIVQDNDFATWRAYNNQYWPAKYFIDRNGVVRFTHFGEGEYDESEKVIQDLLKETGAKNITNKIDNPTYQVQTKTPETYLGSSRNPYKSGFSLVGDWKVMEEYANPQKNAKLLLNFDAKEVYLVMRPKQGSSTVRVYLDDAIQDPITVDSDRLYRLISLPTPGKHTLRLEFDDGNVEAFAFTFG